MLAALTVFSPSARAVLDCVVESTQLTLGHANTYIVPTTSPQIGDFIGTLQRFDIVWRCLPGGNPTQWGILERAVPANTFTGITVTQNNTSLNTRVFTTPELQQLGLGLYAYWYAKDAWTSTHNWYVTNTNTPQPHWWKPIPTPDGQGYVRLGIQMNYRFVKINDNLDAHITGTPIAVAPSIPLAGFVIRDDVSTATSPLAHVTAMLPTITFGQRVCTPFTHLVKLPTLNMGDLPPVGAAGPETDFYIEMRCPTNAGSIGYYAEAVYGVLDAAQGVIGINPASTANGIGLRLRTRSKPDPLYIDASSSPILAEYQPMRFGAGARYGLLNSLNGAGLSVDPLTNPLRTFRASSNTIALKVAVWRTQQEVTPGTFNSAIIIHFVYR